MKGVKEANKTERTDTDEKPVENEGKEEKEESDDFDYNERARKILEEKGIPFASEVLPKLPKNRNGMFLLGVNEQSPLAGCGELYKMRIFRPERPLASSEIYEDGTCIRFTNISRLCSDDFAILKFKIELATYKAGVADEDMVGVEPTLGLFEAEDIGNLTLQPFVEKKVKGKNKL